MSTEELFDDANGDLALGELQTAADKYRRCVEMPRILPMPGTPSPWP
jgi:hypothetical protein